MTLPPLRLEDGNSFFIDNSRYEHIMRCMRSAEYGIVRGRVSSETRQALTFGEAIHLALKFRYKYFNNQPLSIEGQIRQNILLEKFWETHPTPPGDHRTLGFAQALMEAYNQKYLQEQFRVCLLNTHPIVEEGFATPIGKVGDINIIWKGRLDMSIIEQDNSVWAWDNKTTSIGGDYYMMEYFTSNQMKGYTWEIRHLIGKQVKGAIINSLVARKPTKMGKGFEFQRGKFPFDDDVLDEWQENTLHLVSDFLHSYERGFFPMQTTQCIGRFGICQYLDTCRMAPMTRLQELLSESFKNDTFDPLHEDSINLDEIATMPIPSNYRRIEPMIAQEDTSQEQLNQAMRLNQAMKDLLNI